MPDVSSSQPQNSTAAGDVDPFLALHKMSTTAGLGSGDYVAINGTAIAALLLGIASALMLLGAYLLLLIPLVGVACGIFAFRQISDSNGTQTGRGLAGIGLLLSLGFGGAFLGKEFVDGMRNRADEREVTALIAQLESNIKADKYDDAYQLCDDHFKQRVQQEQFVGVWTSWNGRPMLGRIKGIESKILKFETDPVTEDRLGSSLVLVGFEKVQGQDRQGMVFRKTGGKWFIDDLPNIFPADSQPRAGGAGSPAGGGQRQSAVVPSGAAGPPAPKSQ